MPRKYPASTMFLYSNWVCFDYPALIDGGSRWDGPQAEVVSGQTVADPSGNSNRTELRVFKT
jgi:hypothetical protein